MARRFLLTSIGFAALACSAPRRPGGTGGAGGDGGTAGGGDPTGGAGGQGGMGGGAPQSCIEGEQVCDGNKVRTCTGGVPAGPVVEACPASCSEARCVSDTCAIAESKRSFVGCGFYTFDIDNSTHDDFKLLAVLVANPDLMADANVTFETRTPGGAWKMDRMVKLPPSGVNMVEYKDRHFEGPGLGRAIAWRILSDAPIVAYHVQSDDSDGDGETSGGTMLLPQHVYGRDYMAITYPQSTTGQTSPYGPLASAAQVAVVGTRDGTRVTFQVGPKGGTRAGDVVPARSAGESFDVTIDDGDVLQIYSAAEGQDLTGSAITSTAPIAVFSGNIGTSYGRGIDENIESADMTHEQMIPLSTWGTHYVAAYLSAQNGGGLDPTLWRILASEDGTSVRFEAPAELDGVPATPKTINRGQVLDLLVVNTRRGGQGNGFYIESTKPVLLAQFIPWEPAMTLAISAEQLLTDFLFVTPPIFEHEIAIIRKAGTPVKLDGTMLIDKGFSPVGGGYEVARMMIPSCKNAMDLTTCGHRISGTDLGVALRGQDTICGYAFCGGMGLKCVNATVGCH